MLHPVISAPLSDICDIRVLQAGQLKPLRRAPSSTDKQAAIFIDVRKFNASNPSPQLSRSRPAAARAASWGKTTTTFSASRKGQRTKRSEGLQENGAEVPS